MQRIVNSVMFILLLLCSIYSKSLCNNVKPDLNGTWETKIDFGNKTLKIVFHIDHKVNFIKGTWDSPDQGAFGLKIKDISFENNILKIVDNEFQFSFIGIYDTKKDCVEGKFKQAGFNSNFILIRKSKIQKLQ